MNVLQPDGQIEQMLNAVARNQQLVLQVMQIQIDWLHNISELADCIYSPKQVLTPEIYKTFRKLYQNSSTACEILQNYQSLSDQFLRQKDQLVSEQIRYMRIMNNQLESEQVDKQAQRNNSRRSKNQSGEYQGSYEEDRKMIRELQHELQSVNEVLQRNNLQFEQQIKKYNHKLFEMKQTIQKYEFELQKTQQYEVIIDELQNKIFLLREEKDRDTILIENMAKKIRFFEKEKGGRDAFLSPYQSERNRYYISPDSRTYNTAKINSSYYRKYA